MPSFIVIITAVLFLGAIGENKYVQGAFTAVTASSCALIMYSAYTLGKQVINGAFTAVLAGLGFVLVAFFDVNAVLVIVGGALLGCVYSVVKAKRVSAGAAGGDAGEISGAVSDENKKEDE